MESLNQNCREGLVLKRMYPNVSPSALHARPPIDCPPVGPRRLYAEPGRRGVMKNEGKTADDPFMNRVTFSRTDCDTLTFL